MTSAAFDSVCSDFPNYYDAILSKAVERLEKSSRETRPTFGFAPAAAFGAPEEDAKTEVPRPGRCRRGVLLEASH